MQAEHAVRTRVLLPECVAWGVRPEGRNLGGGPLHSFCCVQDSP